MTPHRVNVLMLKSFKYDEMVAGMWIVIIFKHDFVEYGTTFNVNALIIYLCYTSKL